VKKEPFPTSKRPLRVGLFGYYGYGNFGDDLMAVVFGLFLAERNTRISVYRLCRPYAEKYGLPVSYSIEDFMEDKDFIIYGGGGALLRPSSPRRVSKSPFKNELSHLLRVCSERKIPIYAISVGGDGNSVKPLPPLKRSFIESCAYMTVRNPQDLSLLEQAGKHGDCFPDILWQTPQFFPMQRRKNRRPKIGIDIYGWDLARSRAYYLPLLMFLICQIRRDMDFVFLDTVNRSHAGLHVLGRIGAGFNTKRYKFHDPASDMELLTSLDLIISTKLHAGLVCLSYGIPFISLFGREKTALFMKNTHLSELYFNHKRIHRFISLMLRRGGGRHLMDHFQVPCFQSLIDRSYGHLRMLDRVLEEHGEVRPAS
jgi:polysaccharide pyruvyl transferase WcaK-like protein